MLEGELERSKAEVEEQVDTFSQASDDSFGEVAAPLDFALELWEGRERIPEWMPWIASVDVDPADPRLSRWVLRREAFGRDFEFSWTSRNLAVMPAQSYSKIQWRSVEGSAAGVGVPGLNVKNRGEVMLYPRGPDRCQVKLKIEYEVPDALLPMATALDGLVGEILDTDMKGFARFAEEEYQKRQGA